MGGSIAAPGSGFGETCLEPHLSKKYCPAFVTVGYCCDRSGCNGKVHLPFHKWNDEDRDSQIKYVEDNPGKIVIHKKNKRSVGRKLHLLGDENGPTGKQA